MEWKIQPALVTVNTLDEQSRIPVLVFDGGSIGGINVGLEQNDISILEGCVGDHIFCLDGDRGDNTSGKENFIVSAAEA